MWGNEESYVPSDEVEVQSSILARRTRVLIRKLCAPAGSHRRVKDRVHKQSFRSDIKQGWQLYLQGAPGIGTT